MNKIIYESDSAVLSFDYDEMIHALSEQIRELQIDVDSALLDWLQSFRATEKRDITIASDAEEPEFIERITYVIKHLLSDNRGSVFCRACGRDIPASEREIDHASPLDFYRDIDKKAIPRGVRLPGGMGGTTFQCKNGHELFATIDWVS